MKNLFLTKWSLFPLFSTMGFLNGNCKIEMSFAQQDAKLVMCKTARRGHCDTAVVETTAI